MTVLPSSIRKITRKCSKRQKAESHWRASHFKHNNLSNRSECRQCRSISTKSNPRQRNHHRYFRSRNFLWHTDFAEVTPNYKQRRHQPSCCRNQRLSTFLLSRSTFRCFTPFLPGRLCQTLYWYDGFTQYQPSSLASDRWSGMENWNQKTSGVDHYRFQTLGDSHRT